MSIDSKPPLREYSQDPGPLPYVRPPNWRNPTPRARYDWLIVGAGPAGIAAAERGAALGATVALVERHWLGGNSLNVGSVPSKTLLYTGSLSADLRKAADYFQPVDRGAVADFRAIVARMRRVHARIAEYHSAHRLERLGIDVYFGKASFASERLIEIDGLALEFDQALIATGAQPRASEIPGLDQVGYCTSPEIFDLPSAPKNLAVIGGGPLGCELAQAFRRLGSNVTIIENDPKFLPREERDAAEILSRSMARDGVAIRLNTAVVRAHISDGRKTLDLISNDQASSVETDEILLSTGRVANVDGLALDRCGVRCGEDGGIVVDALLRSSNPHIYAAGDVCMSHKFTHVAKFTARMATENALRGARQKWQDLIVPWCTFCDPEVAHVGMQVWEAKQQGIPVTTYTIMMYDVDRAIIDGQDTGFVKLHVQDNSDRILGATLVASRASEMVNEITLAMNRGIGMRDLAKVLHVYPSQAEAIHMTALAYLDAEAMLRPGD